MALKIQPARRSAAKARVCFLGPSGAGKTYTCLEVARGLVGDEGRIAVIDSENRSASLYAGAVTDFDVIELSRTDSERDADRKAHRGGPFLEHDYDPRRYIEAVEMVGDAGYDAVIIDSLTHAWDGTKAIVDEAAKKNRGNSFAGWGEATPIHLDLIKALLKSPCHVLVTLRVKTEWVIEKDPRTGKSVPVKVGLQPEQRAGMEYEFSLVGELDTEHNLSVSKTRYMGLGLDQAVIRHPGRKLGTQIAEWLAGGVPVVESSPAAAPTAMTKAASPVDTARAFITKKIVDEDARAFLLERCDDVDRGELDIDKLRELVKEMTAPAPQADEPPPSDEDAPAEEPASIEPAEKPAVDEFADLEAAIAAVPDKDARRRLHIDMGGLRKGRTTREAIERQIAEATPAASTSSEQPEKTPAERAAALRAKASKYPMARTLEKIYQRLVDHWEAGEMDSAKRSPVHDRLGDAMRACFRASAAWQGPHDGTWNPVALTQDAAWRAVADQHGVPFHIALVIAEWHWGIYEADRILAPWATEPDAEVEPWLEWVESLAVADQGAGLRTTPSRWLEMRRSEVA